MAVCRFSASCGFMVRLRRDTPSYAGLVREHYCAGDYGDCARYLVAGRLGVERVPDHLYPRDMEAGRMIVAGTLER